MNPLLTAYQSLLRLGFYLLYNQLAWTYDLVANAVSLGRWWAWQRQALAFIAPHSRVLELAHGTGHLLTDLHAAGHHPLALDLSPHMSRIAQRRLQRRGLAVPLLRAKAQALPLRAACLDAVVATFPTEYIVDAESIAACARVLKPGGRLVTVLGGMLSGHGLLGRFIRWLFVITGQDVESFPGEMEPVLRRFAAAGLQARIETVTLPDSRVWLLVAEKPG